MKKNILFIIWSLSFGGGAEKALANIVNNLDQSKYNIEILEYLHSDKMETLNPGIRVLPPVLDITKKGIFSKLRNGCIDKLLIKVCPGKIRRIYLNKTYDVEVSFNYLIPTFLLNRDSAMKIAWIHGEVYDLEEKRWLKRMQEKAFDDIDKIVAISERTKQSIIKEFPRDKNKITKIMNGYNFTKMVAEEDLDDFDLLYCNRFDENKNPMKFVQIVKNLKDHGICVTAKMLGSGDLLKKVEQLIGELGLKDQIECVGYKKNPYAYFMHCKVFCLTSYMEGFPTTLVEAMYFGKPFVSTDVAGADELSDNNACGFLVMSDEEYTERIESLLNDTAKYEEMSRNGKQSAVQYTIEKQIFEVEKCLNGE